MNIIKRNGLEEKFDISKIINAISKANETVPEAERLTIGQMEAIADRVELKCQNMPDVPTIEEIQDLVEMGIMKCAAYEVAQHYMSYRYEHKKLRVISKRDDMVLELINSAKSDEYHTVGYQINNVNNKIYKDIARRFILPEYMIEAHDNGFIYLGNMEQLAMPIVEDVFVNLYAALQNGININGILHKADGFLSACSLTLSLIDMIVPAVYGNVCMSIYHLVPFIEVSRKKVSGQLLENEIKEGIKLIREHAGLCSEDKKVRLSFLMYLNEAATEQERDDMALVIEEFFNQQINNKVLSHSYIPIRCLYVIEDANFKPDSKYWYLTEIALKCTMLCMSPDYISEKLITHTKNGCTLPYMDYSTAIATTENGILQYGYFSQGTVTVNLAQIAMEAQGHTKAFWTLLDERLDMCHSALLFYHKRFVDAYSGSSPALWQGRAISSLQTQDMINELLKGGKSTLYLGFAGVHEMCLLMTKEDNGGEKGKKFAIKVLKYLNDRCFEWTSDENIQYTLRGVYDDKTLAFLSKMMTNDTAKEICVTGGCSIGHQDHTDICDWINSEDDFQPFVPGGNLCIVIPDNVFKNAEGRSELVESIYNSMSCVEINSYNDECCVCGYTGLLESIVDKDNGNRSWICPKCGNIDEKMMTVLRRPAEYIVNAQELTQETRKALNNDDNA